MTQWKSEIGVVSGVMHKLDGIGTFPFLSTRFTTPSLTTQWKLGCRSRKQKRKNQQIARLGIKHCHWFILPLLLATPTMQFSLDRKRRSHKQNHYFASDSVGLVFTRSYHSTLLITTATTTPVIRTGFLRAVSQMDLVEDSVLPEEYFREKTNTIVAAIHLLNTVSPSSILGLFPG